MSRLNTSCVCSFFWFFLEYSQICNLRSLVDILSNDICYVNINVYVCTYYNSREINTMIYLNHNVMYVNEFTTVFYLRKTRSLYAIDLF
jgi:hypothetical protein